MKVSLESVKAFCFLANPHRENFKDFVNRIDGKRPQYYISRYMIEKGATDEALDLLQDAGYLEQIHGNYRKTALLNAPGQAILEATILAGMCQQIVEATKVNNLKSYLNFSSVCGMRMINELEQLPSSLFEGTDMYPVICSLSSSYDEYLLTEKTIKYILELWNRKPINVYEMPYEYFKEKINNA